MTRPTTKSIIIALSVLTLVYIVVLIHYQLIANKNRRRSRTKRPAVSWTSPVDQTIDDTTATPARTDVISEHDRFERISFGGATPSNVARPAWTKPCGRFHFQYVLNPSLTCRHHDMESPVFLLNYVHSAVGNFDRRARVRASWANSSNYGDVRVETVFFVGLPSGDKRLSTQAAIEAEFRQFVDIVQVNMTDTYRYITTYEIYFTVMIFTARC